MNLSGEIRFSQQGLQKEGSPTIDFVYSGDDIDSFEKKFDFIFLNYLTYLRIIPTMIFENKNIFLNVFYNKSSQQIPITTIMNGSNEICDITRTRVLL